MRWVPLVLALALAPLPVLAGCGASSPPPASAASDDADDAPIVSGAEARRLIAEGALLLDVRSGFEYALRHLDGAANIPVDELERRAGELDPERPVVVYCLSGHRSAEAGRILRRHGHRRVYDVGSMVGY